MFSGSIIVIATLVVFSPQGTTSASPSPTSSKPTGGNRTSVTPTEWSLAKSTTSASPSPTPSATTGGSSTSVTPTEASSAKNTTSASPSATTDTTSASPSPTPSATTGGSSTPVTPTESSLPRMCGSITIKLKKLNRGNVTEEVYIKAIKSFFNDTKKYTNVEVSDLKIGNSEGETFELSFKLCLVYLSTDGFIEDFLLQQVKEGKLLNISIADGENSFSFEVSGVKFSDLKAKEGECKKCSEGGGGPIVIEGKCEPEPGYSCKGLKNTKEVDLCVEFCNAVSRIMVSTVVMAIGIALSLSYNIWG